MKKVFMFFVFSILSVCLFSSSLKIVTENYPPYNYNDDGKIKGVCTEIVQAVLKEAKINSKIHVYPWARTYNMALETPNVLIFSMARMPKREKLFKWIGIIVRTQETIYKLKERTDINPKNWTEIKKNYKVGAIRFDAGEFDLGNKGLKVPELDLSSDIEEALSKLIAKRIDIAYTGKLSTMFTASNLGNGNLIKEVVGPDVLKSDLYMACSISTDDSYVTILKKSLKKIKKNGIYDNILNKWKRKYELGK